MRFPFFGASLVGGTIIFFILLGRALAAGTGERPTQTDSKLSQAPQTDPNIQNYIQGCRGVSAKMSKGLRAILIDDPCDKCLRVAKVAAENAATSMALEIQKKICSKNPESCQLENLAPALVAVDALDPVKGCMNPCQAKCIPTILPQQYDPNIKGKIAELLEEQERQRIVHDANSRQSHNTGKSQQPSGDTNDEEDDGNEQRNERKSSRGCSHCARSMSKIGKQTARAFVRGLCDCNGLHCWNVYENGLLSPVCHLVAGSAALAMNTLWTGTTTVAVCTAVCAHDGVKGVVQGQLE